MLDHKRRPVKQSPSKATSLENGNNDKMSYNGISEMPADDDESENQDKIEGG
jgi:hypothetical protein